MWPIVVQFLAPHGTILCPLPGVTSGRRTSNDFMITTGCAPVLFSSSMALGTGKCERSGACAAHVWRHRFDPWRCTHVPPSTLHPSTYCGIAARALAHSRPGFASWHPTWFPEPARAFPEYRAESRLSPSITRCDSITKTEKKKKPVS